MSPQYPHRSNLMVSLCTAILVAVMMLLMQGTDDLLSIVAGAVGALIAANLTLYTIYHFRYGNQ